MQIRPWPFHKEERVIAYWFCSLKQERGKWLLEVIFSSLEQEKREIVKVAWGSLPYIRLGRIYVDGCITEQEPLGTTEKITAWDLSQGEIRPATDLTHKLWSLHQSSLMCAQKIWRSQVAETTVYIPCVELVRAFYANRTFLAKQMTNHYGLELLLQERSVEESGRRICYVFAEKVPHSLVTDQLAFQVAWILENPQIRNRWGQIARTITVGKGTSDKGLPLAVAPPPGKYGITYRGIKSGNKVLVLEITQISGFRVPFEQLEYVHPAFSRQKATGDTQGGTRSTSYPREEVSDYAAGDDGFSTLEQDIAVSMAPPTIQVKPAHLRIRRMTPAENTDVLERRQKMRAREGAEDAVKRTATTQESQWGGQCKPLEIQGSELLDAENREGLTDFLAAIEKLARVYREWKFSIQYVPLPEDIKITRYDSGQRRCYAVVTACQGTQSILVVEVARPDQWQIATLVIQDDNGYEELPSVGEFISKSGHWMRDDLAKLPGKVKFLKHTKNNTFNQLGEFFC